MGNLEDISSYEDLITPERLAKGDLEVAINNRKKINRAIPANLTIIKELIRRGVLPYHYEIYGVGFLELQNAFRAPWAIRSSAVLMEQWGVGVSNSRADSIYQIVTKTVGAPKIDIIQYVLETKERRVIKKMQEKERRKNFNDRYKECFERLVQSMDEEREKLYRELNEA